MTSDSKEVSRQQLYELVWTRPARVLAQEFGVSDVGLAKICRRLLVPRPYRGYWAKKENGHPVRQARLPPWPPHLGKEPDGVAIEPSGRMGRHNGAGDATDSKVPKGPRIEVADDLTDPHPLVERSQRLLERGKTWSGKLRPPPRERRCLDLHVEPGSVDRALRILDALLKALEGEGHAVRIADKEPWRTIVTVSEEEIAIAVEEQTQRVERPQKTRSGPERLFAWQKPRPEYDWRPTGQLTFRILDQVSAPLRRAWSDGDKQRLERCLNSVVIGLARIVEAKKADRLEAERREREWREAEQRRQEHLREQLRHDARVREVDRQIASWRKAQEVRTYLEALEVAATQVPGGLDLASRLAHWIRWVRAYLASIDPLAEVANLPRDPNGWGAEPLDLLQQWGEEQPCDSSVGVAQ